MKPLEDQVCSQVLSERLNALGVKQESIFYWGKNIRDEWTLNCPNRDKTTFCSAFTSTELATMFPPGGSWMQEATAGGYRVWMSDRVPPYEWKEFTWSETEADARAKMLIYLIENKLIEMPK